MADQGYLEHIESVESDLRPYAFKTKNISNFTDATDAIQTFETAWRKDGGRARLTGRSPLMLERDRILYSNELRSQSDRHHVLFLGDARVSRDYASHILRMSQVSRAICGRLGLNTDLAEAIALGAKVGGVPFIHVGKRAVDEWVRERVKALDKGAEQPLSGSARHTGAPRQMAFVDADGDQLALPGWVDEIADENLRRKVQELMPWAAGAASMAAYSSGQQSYWVLSFKPFQLVGRSPFVPQTMYGIWNHSLGSPRTASRFHHHIKLATAGQPEFTLRDSDLTHEAVVVRYADDITWVIENLNEASKAASLAGSPNATFNMLATVLKSNDLPPDLQIALTPVPDLGRIYTYFINDLVVTSQSALEEAETSGASEADPAVKLSMEADRMLHLMKSFLTERVFSDDRIVYRNRTLVSIIQTVLDVYWDSPSGALQTYLDGKAMIEGWTPDEVKRSNELLADPVHRVQASVDALASMSDREVYRLLGLEAM